MQLAALRKNETEFIQSYAQSARDKLRLAMRSAMAKTPKIVAQAQALSGVPGPTALDQIQLSIDKIAWPAAAEDLSTVTTSF